VGCGEPPGEGEDEEEEFEEVKGRDEYCRKRGLVSGCVRGRAEERWLEGYGLAIVNRKL